MTRAEAIGHLKNIAIYSFQDGYTDEARQALDMAIKALEEPQWIPISERLPEENEDVLITDEDGDVYIAYYDRNDWSEDSKIEWYTGHFRADPVAWMPLPKAYEGEEEHETD